MHTGAVVLVERLVQRIGRRDRDHGKCVEGDGRPPEQRRGAAIENVDQVAVVEKQDIPCQVATRGHIEQIGRRRIIDQAGVGTDGHLVGAGNSGQAIVKSIAYARSSQGIGIARQVGVSVVKDEHFIAQAQIHRVQIDIVALGIGGADSHRTCEVLLAGRTGQDALLPLGRAFGKNGQGNLRQGCLCSQTESQCKKKSVFCHHSLNC